MRIAVLYSGQLRTWQRVKNNQSTNLVGDTDLFFFTTEEPENTEYKQFVRDWTGSYYSPFLHDYDSNKNQITQLHGSLNQWHVRFVNFSIVPTDYDVYCNSRPDIEIGDKVDFSQYEMRDNVVYIPEGNDHCGGVNDQMAFGNYMSMKKYFSIYTQHHKLFAQGKTFHTEYYVTENLKAQGVEIVRIPQTTIIIRENQPTVYSEGSLRIASENPKDHWKMLKVKDKSVLDLGAGRVLGVRPSTPEYFLSKGATSVVGVEMSDSEKKWHFENIKDVRLTMITDRVDTPDKLNSYLIIFKPQVIKIDIEGDERILEDFEKEDLECVEQMAIEYHNNTVKQMINRFYKDWGFISITEYRLQNFNSNEQGVLYLKK